MTTPAKRRLVCFENPAPLFIAAARHSGQACPRVGAGCLPPEVYVPALRACALWQVKDFVFEKTR